MSLSTNQILRADVAQRLDAVHQRITAAAAHVGRSAEDVRLIAVSKTHSLDVIEAAYDAGQRDFGENRFEELWSKVEAARARGLDAIRWHFIGTIQSRKTGQAVGPFALVHSVDRLKIAQRLQRDAEAVDATVQVLLQVNISGEASKQGFTPDALLEAVSEVVLLPNLRAMGLMTMAPFVDDVEQTRSVFRQLAALRDEVRQRAPASAWASSASDTWCELSMGMSNDFEVAIEEGSTIVRIGSAIFGERPRE